MAENFEKYHDKWMLLTHSAEKDIRPKAFW
jgi:hypothetical protein